MHTHSFLTIQQDEAQFDAVLADLITQPLSYVPPSTPTASSSPQQQQPKQQPRLHITPYNIVEELMEVLTRAVQKGNHLESYKQSALASLSVLLLDDLHRLFSPDVLLAGPPRLFASTLAVRLQQQTLPSYPLISLILLSTQQLVEKRRQNIGALVSLILHCCSSSFQRLALDAVSVLHTLLPAYPLLLKLANDTMQVPFSLLSRLSLSIF